MTLIERMYYTAIGVRMDIRNYAKVTALNAILVIAGALIAPIIAHTDRLITVVHAQVTRPPTKAQTQQSLPIDDAEYVTPTMTAGAVAFNQLLAHQVAADQVMVQGIDLLKLDQNILNLLISRGIPASELQKAVNDARVARPLKLKPGQPAQ